MATAVKRNDTIASVQAVFDDNATLTARVDELERERNEHWGVDTKLIAERDAARAKVEEMERELLRFSADSINLRKDLSNANRWLEEERAKGTGARQYYDDILEEYINLVAKQSAPDSLSAILRELAEEGIWCSVAVGVGDDNCYQVVVSGVHPDSRSNLAESDVAAFIESATIKAHPTSSFARRRAEATVEPVDPLTAMFADNPSPWIYDEDMGFARDVNRDPVMVTPAIVAAVNAYQPPQATEPRYSARKTDSGFWCVYDRILETPVSHFANVALAQCRANEMNAEPTPDVPPAPAAADPVREFYKRFHGTFSFRPSEANSRQELHHGDDYVALLVSAFSVHEPIATVLNRYRAIESAADKYGRCHPSVLGNEVYKILRTSEKEA